MVAFVEEVASDLYSRYGREVSRLRILFPSRRAQLFFTDALSRLTDVPIWQPQFESIDRLMTSIAGIEHGERVRLITELYNVYREFHPDEKFDKFYFWGEMLLNDFDAIDKYLIDADVLFANISDLKQIESDLSYITDRQWEVITRFWSVLNDDKDPSLHKQRFLKVWRTLCPVYHRFRERLRELGIGYGGMIQREAVARIEAAGFELEDGGANYVIAGFNALSKCEKRLFDYLAVNRTTDFYWDYDRYYLDERQEAGLFLRENLVRFPQSTTFTSQIDNLSTRDKQLTSVATASNVLQCKYVNRLLRQMMADGVPMDKRTAIVLTDENLLQPLLYSMPEGVKLNITMGFPVRQTVAYSLVERLIELQNRRRESSSSVWFYHSDVLGLLSHPYLSNVLGVEAVSLSREIVDNQRVYIPREELAKSPLLTQLFAPVAEWQQMSDYLLAMIAEASRSATMADDALRREAQYLSVVAENIMQLRNSLDQCAVEITLPIYTSLLRRHLQTVRIPFEGEPLYGVQIMGILETRNLDFDNVIILSMNDDNFPGNRASASSFIPYGLRAAYGLPTPEHHEGVYAYYFYRLIQRARNIYMVYCSQSDEKSSGEASRYIRQLDYESGMTIHKVDFGVDINLSTTSSFSIAKQGDVRQKLERFLTDPTASLSPTALYRYIACPMRFYFASVARIRSEEEITEEIDAPMFGTILHEAMRTLYEPLKSAVSTSKAIEAITDEQITAAVDRAINENYLHREKATAEDYGGNILLVRDIICRYIRSGILTYDAAHADFRVENIEHEVATPFRFEAGDRSLQVVFKGTADRIDTMDSGMVRVVDYKTGAQHLEFDGVENLFKGKGKQRQSNTIQTLLYSMMISHSEHRAVMPALYYVRDLGREEYSPQLVEVVPEGRTKTRRPVESYAAYAEEFERHLAETLGELFDFDTPFTQCEDSDTCTYCDYADICRR
ncbi:MAG: PD-(D/E)XK nuclease family protein [Rikenellaceae bacterium]|nr:PD-(D/E)XK nuclease family protein [Rikenellaceae bacterium]